MSTNDIMLEGLSAIITALGGELPAAFRKTTDAGILAGRKVATAFDGTAKAVVGVGTALDGTDWAGWSQEAVDAARDAEAAVDGVTFGTSPGGLKEIPIMLQKATTAAQAFGDAWQSEMRAAQLSVDGGIGAYAGMQTAATAAAGAGHVGTPGRPRLHSTFHINALDTNDMQRAVEQRVLPAMIKALKRGYSLTEMREVVTWSGPKRTK